MRNMTMDCGRQDRNVVGGNQIEVMVCGKPTLGGRRNLNQELL
ncbi:hypothetical protein A2U01_0103591, partial [Trifolium medium]|nr:hypothetical protein [Trifolium medium]